MSVKAGMVLPPKTTIQEFLDLVYSNRHPDLPSNKAVFTVLEDNRLVVSWPNYNDVVFWTLSARALPPEWILYE